MEYKFNSLEYKFNSLDNIKKINHFFHLYSNEKNILNYYNKVFDIYKNNESFLSLGIKLNVIHNNFDKIVEMLNLIDKPKKRHFITIFNYYYDNNIEIFEFYKNNLYNKFILDNDDYIKLISQKNNLDFILYDMITNINLNINIKMKDEILKLDSCILTNNNNNKCNNCKNILLLDDNILFKKDKLIEDCEKIIKKKINHKYNIILDGGNILYYQDGKLTNKSIFKLDTIYNYFKINNYNPCIILHKRHRKLFLKINKDIDKFYEKWNVIETPYNFNDDYYLIYICLINDNSYIITNDKFRDHKFHSFNNDEFQKFLKYKIINFDFINKSLKKLKIIYPKYNSLYDKYYHFQLNNEVLCIII